MARNTGITPKLPASASPSWGGRNSKNEKFYAETAVIKPVTHIPDNVGKHLFTVDEKYCTIYYRGFIEKETEKVFFITNKTWRGNSYKVLKSNNFVVVATDQDPEHIIFAFETVKASFRDRINALKAKLVVEQDRQFKASMAALHAAAGIELPKETGDTTTAG